MNNQVEKIRAKVEQFYQLRVKALKDDCFTGRERADITTECGILRQVLNYIDNSLQSSCSDCTNDKGCINCVDGNMYEKTKQEMLKVTPNEEFENFAKAYMEENDANIVSFYDRYAGLVDGVRWQKVNLWKDAQGDDLPEINREVIVLYQRYPLENNEYAVGFGHRPPEYWDGKNIDTGEVTRYYPKKYDKGGWNSPNIKWWLDISLPYKGGEE